MSSTELEFSIPVATNPKQPCNAMKATYIQIYDLLMQLPTEEKVVVAVPDKRSAESLRTALVRRHAEFVAVEIGNDSLCADFDEKASTLSIWIGRPRRRQPVAFEIVSHHAGTLRSSVECDPQEFGASDSSLPESSPGETDQSDPAAEEQGQRASESS